MSATNTSTTNEQIIDLDDPAFLETQNYDPNQDIDVRILPPEIDSDGNAVDYVVKLTIGENSNQQKKPYGKITNKGTKYIALNVKTQVLAEGKPYDNAFVQFPFGNVSTMSFNGTSSMVNLARVLGQPMPQGLNQQDQASYMVGLLETEPKAGCRIQWTGYCTKCQKDIPQLTGEKHWPQKVDATGQVVGHESLSECPECGSDVQARVNIKRLIPIS